MYRDFYDLKKKPFQISADPEFLWLGPIHEEGLAILKYGVSSNKGFLILSGDVGTGKTTLVHALLDQLDDRVVVAAVPDPGLELIELYRFIASSFGMEGGYKSKVDFLFEFKDFLKKMHAQGRIVLLIIDEAQRLSSTMLEEIRLLSNIEMPEHKLLNIFFVGQEEFYQVIAAPENRALKQRITINYHLKALSLEETRTLIDYRLKVAGATEPIFDEAAIEGIYSFSRGHPRRINILCDHALLTGFVKNRPIIGADIIEECSEELRLPGELLGKKRPPAYAAGPHASEWPPAESPPSTAPNLAAAAIQSQAAPDAFAPAAPPRQGRKRVLMVAATLLVTVLAAVAYFKPQHVISPPSGGETIAAGPRAGAVQAETAAPDQDGFPPSKLKESVFHPNNNPNTPDEVAVEPTSTLAAPLEQTTAAAGSEEVSATPPETPLPIDSAATSSDLETPVADDIDPAPAGIDIAAAAPSLGTEAPPAAVAPPATVDDGPDAPDAAAEERPLPDSTIETAPPAAIARAEIASAARPSPIDQDSLREMPSPPKTEDDASSTKAEPETAKPPPLQTADNDPPSAGSLDEPDRSDSQAPSESVANAPEVPRPQSSPATGQPAQSVTKAAVKREAVMVAAVPKAPLQDKALQPPTTAERLKLFLQTYCQTYSAKNLDRFTALFTADAVERDRPFVDLIPIYRANFKKLNEVSYEIDMQTYTESADGSEILIKGDFRLLYRLEGQDWKTSGGLIEMKLVKLDDAYRVKWLDYRKEN